MGSSDSAGNVQGTRGCQESSPQRPKIKLACHGRIPGGSERGSPRSLLSLPPLCPFAPPQPTLFRKRAGSDGVFHRCQDASPYRASLLANHSACSRASSNTKDAPTCLAFPAGCQADPLPPRTHYEDLAVRLSGGGRFSVSIEPTD